MPSSRCARPERRIVPVHALAPRRSAQHGDSPRPVIGARDTRVAEDLELRAIVMRKQGDVKRPGNDRENPARRSRSEARCAEACGGRAYARGRKGAAKRAFQRSALIENRAAPPGD